jgi:outer membrane lipoprotein-sorting protein
MSVHRIIPLIAFFTISGGIAAAETLAAIEARLDQAAPVFSSVSANLKKSSFTKVINDTTDETGTILIKRVKQNDMRVKIEFTGTDARTAVFHERKYEVLLPKLKVVQEYDLGQYGALVDQFMLLGFGTSGKSLAQNYDIKVVKQEELDGQQTTRLELLPKSKEARVHLLKIEMWIPEGQSYPIQQKLHFPSGNFDTVTYSGVKLNAPMSDDALKLQLPKGVKREFPQR